ncbi:hypothetical protein COCCU_01590 [Corynebacterium occultum]|uniref:Oxidoreductase n=1 Tax=Corynebacterium occultum TaxID=2675219 RepID=A0A6B8WIH6_9CORY|nr:hypothetical protein [Corynebacterium occultum]QGU06278.1 hypothetical protein COCCU_01590 [Corynebacterium occultum]
MTVVDPLHPLLNLGEVAELHESARAAIAAVHRRPVSLRHPEVTGSESVLRGARLSTLIDGHDIDLGSEPAGPLGQAISCYSLLAPGKLESSARTFGRAPLQVLARMDVLAGGDGVPVAAAGATRLRTLTQVIVGGAHDGLLPQIVHGEIASAQIFGPRSGLVARAACRLAAVHSGFDPRGLAVPESYLNRHRREYAMALAGFGGGPEGVGVFLELMFRAWEAGAAEAEAIAQAAA